jgi:hypothetical protein
MHLPELVADAAAAIVLPPAELCFSGRRSASEAVIRVDEDLPQAAVEMPGNRGYEADSVIEQGVDGPKDHALCMI